MNPTNTTRLKRIEQRKKMFKIGALTLGLLLIIGFGLMLSRLRGFYNKINTGAVDSKTQQAKEKTEYNILLLGYGGGNHDGTYLTDTIMVANMNLKDKKVVLVSIPRDIWVQVPTKTDPFHTKINAVYQMGLFPKNYPDVDSSLLTKDNPSGLIKKVVENITGLPIDAYFAVDFQGFIQTIDTLNGIDVEVKKSFTDYEYPIEGKEEELCDKEEEFKQIEPFLKPGYNEEDKTKLFQEKPELEEFFNNITDDPEKAFPCRYETLTFDKGTVHMDGETALKFARSRHSEEDGGDYNRAHRQQQVLSAVKDKVLRIDFIPKILPLMNDLENNVATDMPLADINKLLLEGRNANTYKVTSFVVSEDYLSFDVSDNGQSIVVPTSGLDNWSDIKQKVRDVRLGISPTPTKAPVTITPAKNK